MNTECNCKSLVSVFLLSLLLLACQAKKADPKNGPSKRPAPTLDGYVIKTESYSELIEIPGSIVANEATEIHSEVSGRIVGKHIGRGGNAIVRIIFFLQCFIANDA